MATLTKTITAKAHVVKYNQRQTATAKANIRIGSYRISAKASINRYERKIEAKAYVYNGERRRYDARRRIFKGKLDVINGSELLVSGGVVQTPGIEVGGVTKTRVAPIAITGERAQLFFPVVAPNYDPLNEDSVVQDGYELHGVGWETFSNVLHHNMTSMRTLAPGDYLTYDFELVETTTVGLIMVKDGTMGKIDIWLDDVMNKEALDLFTLDNVLSRATVWTIPDVAPGPHQLRIVLRTDTSDPEGVRKMTFEGVTLGNLISSQNLETSVHSIVWTSTLDAYGYKEFNIQSFMIPLGYDVLATLSSTIYSPDPSADVLKTGTFCTTSTNINNPSPTSNYTVTVDSAKGFWIGGWVLISKSGDVSEWIRIYDILSPTSISLTGMSQNHGTGSTIRAYFHNAPKVMVNREAIEFYDGYPYETVEFRANILTSKVR